MRAFRLNFLTTLFFALISIGTSKTTFAQKKYWINFTDKDIENYDYSKYLTKEALNNRKRNGSSLHQYSDAPINNNYLDSINELGITIISKSRWFNCVSANLTVEEVKIVSDLGFVKEIRPLGLHLTLSGEGDINYSQVLKQLGVLDFERIGVNGKGVSIGIIDAGFAGADSNQNFSHVFLRNGVKGTKDFLNPGRNDFYENVTRADYHGRKVWNLIGGYDDTTETKFGLATGADFYLARTEDGLREYRVEEDAWLAAIEWMDSLGVRLVSTSLGYTNSFDDVKDNYTATEMDGKTSIVAQAAELAATEKGIFVVISAGNEGNIDWGTLSTPADAKSALAVGACGYKSYKKAGYSSFGPEYTSFVKPDVVCYSTNGTSYSAPSIAGFVACLIELKPQISNQDLMDLVHKSSHLYPYPNNYIGYGVPSANVAIELINKSGLDNNKNCEVKVKGKEWLHTYEYAPILTPVCFHKKDATHVIKQEELDIVKRKSKNKEVTKEERKAFKKERKQLRRAGKYVAKKYSIIKVVKEPGATRTTVHTGNDVYELIWDH